MRKLSYLYFGESASRLSWTDYEIYEENRTSEVEISQIGKTERNTEPLTFILVMDEISKRANKSVERFRTRTRNLKPIVIKEFLYADDLVAVISNKNNIQEVVKMRGRMLNEYG